MTKKIAKRVRKYKDGYKVKLDYYLEQYWNALDAKDLDGMDKYMRKLSYFHFKHESYIRNERFQAIMIDGEKVYREKN